MNINMADIPAVLDKIDAELSKIVAAIPSFNRVAEAIKSVFAVSVNWHYRKSHYEAGESGSNFQRWTSFLSCLSDC